MNLIVTCTGPERQEPKRLDISFSVIYTGCLCQYNKNRSGPGHKQDRLVVFGVPWAASKSYVPIIFVVMLAHDTRWPHGEYIFTQLVDCRLVDKVAYLEAVRC